MFFGLSVLGTFTYGYFFSFHLLHIAVLNQLLKRVIQAVTTNGMYLLHIAVLNQLLKRVIQAVTIMVCIYYT